MSSLTIKMFVFFVISIHLLNSSVFCNHMAYVVLMPEDNHKQNITAEIVNITSFGEEIFKHDVFAEEEIFQQKELNERPIIGIVSQELSRGMQRSTQNIGNYSSYIAASYIKFVEAAGARVVPVLMNKSDEYYENLGNSLNGFIFPGGGVPFDSEYGRTLDKIFDIVKISNQLNNFNSLNTSLGEIENDLNQNRVNSSKGGPLALWATCLGFENLLRLESQQDKFMTRCNASNIADPLTFIEGYENSFLFNDMPQNLVESLAKENLTANFHNWCITPETFHSLGLNKTMSLLSTNVDREGLKYISTIEYHHAPIFGTQWHPEKAAFEWASDKKHDAIPHSLKAIQVSQFLAEKFIQKARENLNRFSSVEEEASNLIYNYATTFVAPLYKSSFQECYFFE